MITLTHIILSMKRLAHGESRKASTVNGQVIKSTGRMPWHWEPMKDVISCDKLRGDANSYRSEDFRMGKPGYLNR